MTQRNRVLAYVKRCYNWGIENSKVENNPCTHIKTSKEAPDDRFLSRTEIRNLIQNMPKSGLEDWYQDYILLCLLTGMRPGEVASIRLDCIDMEDRTQTLHQTKVGRQKKDTRPYVLPLSNQSLEVIERQRERTDSEWLFPMKTKPTRHLNGTGLTTPLKGKFSQLKVLPFSPRNLRTTVATEISNVKDENGQTITRFLKDRLLNHADQSVNRYAKAEYEKTGNVPLLNSIAYEFSMLPRYKNARLSQNTIERIIKAWRPQKQPRA
jgi:integrase